MTTKTAKFIFKHSTKGAHRYQECDEKGNPLKPGDKGCLIGTLYVRKDEFGENSPAAIKVDVTTA